MRCKVSDNEWLDLALVRRIQFEAEPPVAVITWFDGSTQVYNGKEASVIVADWIKVNAVPDDLHRWRKEKEHEISQILKRRGGTMLLIDLLEISDVPYSVVVSLESAGRLTIQSEMVLLPLPY